LNVIKRAQFSCCGVISALHHVLHFVNETWCYYLLVPVKTAVDLQLLQRRCEVIQLPMNRSRSVSVVLNLIALQPTQHCSILERSFCFGTLNALGWLWVIYILTKASIYISRQILTQNTYLNILWIQN